MLKKINQAYGYIPSKPSFNHIELISLRRSSMKQKKSLFHFTLSHLSFSYFNFNVFVYVLSHPIIS